MWLCCDSRWIPQHSGLCRVLGAPRASGWAQGAHSGGIRCPGHGAGLALVTEQSQRGLGSLRASLEISGAGEPGQALDPEMWEREQGDPRDGEIPGNRSSLGTGDPWEQGDPGNRRSWEQEILGTGGSREQGDPGNRRLEPGPAVGAGTVPGWECGGWRGEGTPGEGMGWDCPARSSQQPKPCGDITPVGSSGKHQQ